MSYILDALKKAERERSISQVPTLMSVHDTEPETPSRRPWVIAGVCLISIAMLCLTAVLLWRQTGTKNGSPAQHMEEATQSSSLATREAPPRAAVPSDPPVSSETQAESREENAISSSRRPGAGSDFTPRPRPVPETAEPIQKPSARPLASPSNPAPATEEPSATAAPLSLREAMAKMTMTIHMYSETKSERMAFINDHKYQEGEYVDGRYLLESITAEGVVLSYQGERAILRPKSR